MNYRKTTRTYGAIWNLIRDYTARFPGPFSPAVFTPAVTYVQARNACARLCAQGELTPVTPHKLGRHGAPQTYIAARPTSPTSPTRPI